MLLRVPLRYTWTPNLFDNLSANNKASHHNTRSTQSCLLVFFSPNFSDRKTDVDRVRSEQSLLRVPCDPYSPIGKFRVAGRSQKRKFSVSRQPGSVRPAHWLPSTGRPQTIRFRRLVNIGSHCRLVSNTVPDHRIRVPRPTNRATERTFVPRFHTDIPV